jgi:hypothetical protein
MGGWSWPGWSWYFRPGAAGWFFSGGGVGWYFSGGGGAGVAVRHLADRLQQLGWAMPALVLA